VSVCLSFCLSVCAHGFLGPNISKTVKDRDLVTMDNQWEIAYGKSIYLPDQWRHVTLKGQGRDPKMFGAHYLENDWRYRLSYNSTPIGNGTWGIKLSHDRWRRWSVNRDLGMFGRERGSLEKSHGIGQTPCSYEHYLVNSKYLRETVLFSFTCVCRLFTAWFKLSAWSKHACFESGTQRVYASMTRYSMLSEVFS